MSKIEPVKCRKCHKVPHTIVDTYPSTWYHQKCGLNCWSGPRYRTVRGSIKGWNAVMEKKS